MSGALKPTVARRVGVVGGGQLARMMGDEASTTGVALTVLAQSLDDSATSSCDAVLIGDPTDALALRRLAAAVEVITFDHELVNLELLEELEAEDVMVRPNARALRFAVDKAFQREAFSRAGLPVPRFLVLRTSSDERLSTFLGQLSAPPVVKAARGGYDGRGVLFPTSREATHDAIDELGASGDVLVEERLELRGEFAQSVARDCDGATVFYPVVATLQRDGMCVEVRYPSGLDEARETAARVISERVASLVQGVGIMAIEYFDTDEGLVVNEIALRPHNSGHWTIEGARTSQFAQHLRCVSGQDLGDVATTARHAVMVNVVGAEAPGSLEAARRVEGVAVHDYGKTWRRGRKLGHVTALDDDAHRAHVRAWNGAVAFGTGTREA